VSVTMPASNTRSGRKTYMNVSELTGSSTKMSANGSDEVDHPR